jgi:1-acyl-sn-glycerol-3-phosphate acyltransferase
METKNTPKKTEPEEKKPVSPEKARTFIYSLARFVAFIGNHTLFPVRYHGKENFDLKAPYIAMSNHNSAMDPLILAYPCKKYEIRFVGKKELVKVKWIGNLLNKGLHMITVDRHHSDMAAMRLFMKTLREGYVLGIFPEGTRHHEDLMSEVETGAAVLALRAQAPILPVYIQSKPRLFRVNHVYIGKPMDISDLAAQGFNTDVVEALCQRIRDTFWEMRENAEAKK